MPECELVQVHIFFSAHGVPVAYVEEAGDPYKAEMEECVELIMNEVKKRNIPNPHTLAYQVRFPDGKVVTWTFPNVPIASSFIMTATLEI